MAKHSTQRILTAAVAAFLHIGVLAQDQASKPQQKAPGSLVLFFDDLDAALKKKNRSHIDQCFDLQRMLERTLQGVGEKGANAEAFKRGVKSTFSFASTMLRQQNSGKMRRLKIVRVGKEWRGLYRRISREGAVGYIELVTERRGSSWKVVDSYTYHQGELNSQLMRRFFLMAMAAQGRGDKTVLEDLRQVHGMVRKARSGKLREALAEYERLPGELRRAKPQMLVRLRCAQQLGGKAYQKALQDFALFTPKHDPSRSLVLIDYYTNRNENDKVLECLDVLERRTGDPYLLVLAASVYVRMKDLDHAIKLTDVALKRESSLLLGHVTALRASMAKADHEHTVSVLRRFQRRFRPKLDAIRKIDGYEAFAASEQGQAWLTEVSGAATPVPGKR